MRLHFFRLSESSNDLQISREARPMLQFLKSAIDTALWQMNRFMKLDVMCWRHVRWTGRVIPPGPFILARLDVFLKVLESQPSKLCDTNGLGRRR